MSTIAITPDSTRYDLMDSLAREGFGIVEPDAPLDPDTDAYRWRYYAGELVQQLGEEEFRSAFDYIARMHDVDIIELDSVAAIIMEVLCCTPEAAAALREYVFDGISDSSIDLNSFKSDLYQFYTWYPDNDALESDEYIERDGMLYELEYDTTPIPCEAEIWYDISYGYLVVWS